MSTTETTRATSKKVRFVTPKVKGRDAQAKQLSEATSRVKAKVSIDFVKAVRGR